MWLYILKQSFIRFFKLCLGFTFTLGGASMYTYVDGWLIVNGSFKSFNWLKLMNQFISDFETGKIDKKMKTLDT